MEPRRLSSASQEREPSGAGGEVAEARAGSEVAEARRWQQRAARFRRSSASRALIQLGTTLAPLAVVFVVMYLALGVSVWITLALAPIAAGFLIRTFIIMHDCAHGSFTPSRRANEITGFLTGVVTMAPFAQWRRDHASIMRRRAISIGVATAT
jgi:omega-6 fatty acid desaturase (delta-12 desaturase)